VERHQIAGGGHALHLHRVRKIRSSQGPRGKKPASRAEEFLGAYFGRKKKKERPDPQEGVMSPGQAV